MLVGKILACVCVRVHVCACMRACVCVRACVIVRGRERKCACVRVRARWQNPVHTSDVRGV